MHMMCMVMLLLSMQTVLQKATQTSRLLRSSGISITKIIQSMYVAGRNGNFPQGPSLQTSLDERCCHGQSLQLSYLVFSQ